MVAFALNNLKVVDRLPSVRSLECTFTRKQDTLSSCSLQDINIALGVLPRCFLMSCHVPLLRIIMYRTPYILLTDTPIIDNPWLSFSWLWTNRVELFEDEH
jgi:hypothetical protein